MANKPQSLDDLFEEVAETTRQAYDAGQTPEAIANRARKAQAEFDRGVRLGWHDKEGNPIEMNGEEEE